MIKTLECQDLNSRRTDYCNAACKVHLHHSVYKLYLKFLNRIVGNYKIPNFIIKDGTG